MNGISVAKVQTNNGRTQEIGNGFPKYERKNGLTAHTVAESKAAPAACATTDATAKLLHSCQRNETTAIATKLSTTVNEKDENKLKV